MKLDAVQTYADLKAYIRDRGGLANVGMFRLRDIHGAGKLGVHVVASISERLSAQGLGHQPEALPSDQNEIVCVYELGSTVGRVFNATRTVNNENTRFLRELANNDAADQVKRIREIVCD